MLNSALYIRTNRLLEHNEQMDQAIYDTDPIGTYEQESLEPPVDYEITQEVSTPNYNDSLNSYTR